MDFLSTINLYAWASLVNLFFSLLLGLLVFMHNPRRRLFQTFFFLNIAIAIWSLGYFFWQISNTYVSALFWTRILSLGSTAIPPIFLHWSLSLLNLNKKRKKTILFFYILSVVFLLFGFSKIFVSSVESNNFFEFWPMPGPLYSIYLFFAYIPVVLWGNYLIFRKYQESRGIERLRIKWVMFGTALSFLGGSTNFLLWYNVSIPPVGHFLVASYPIFFSYSISRYRFMDLKSLINRSITFGLLILIISGIFASLSALVATFFGGLVGFKSNLVAGLIVGLLIATLYRPLSKIFEDLTNKLFFKKRYNPDELLSRVSEVTSSILNFSQLLAELSKTLIDAFHCERIGVVLINKENDKRLDLAYVEGVKPEIAQALVNYKDIVKTLKAEVKQVRGALVIDEMKTRYENGEFKPADPGLLYALHQNDIALIVPLFTKEKLTGVIAIGSKKSGDPYNQQDLNVLDIVAGQAAVAIENAQLYEEQRKFNITLQKKVEEATQELRDANTQLRDMDRTKSEFISIASHQLRTPLTVIKGYISMIREGSFGKAPETIMDQLEKVYTANERLIGLVENLLDISRIESGRQEFTWQKLRIDGLAAEVVEELKKNAGDKGLKLTFHKPAKPLPPALIDRNKLHEVMMNFVDNSIKYTEKGKIDVHITPEPAGMVTFSVKDTGMGIKEDTLPYLFQKFTRGKGSFKVHTEGVGLGLYVARMIIEAHKGVLGVESAGTDQGARFFFQIPLTGPNTKNYKSQEPIHHYLGK